MIFRNGDELPPLPLEINRSNLIEWGNKLVSRSQRYADLNRIGSLYFRPLSTVLTALTGAAGVSVLVNSYYGILVVALSASATALNALLLSSHPEYLYKFDRATQTTLWRELNAFISSTGVYSDSHEISVCRQFAVRMTDIVNLQVKEWSKLPISAPPDIDSPPTTN